METLFAKPGEVEQVLPEFGRTSDVSRLFGIKRGTLANLHREGKVRSARVRGIRLWDLGSIRQLITSNLEGS